MTSRHAACSVMETRARVEGCRRECQRRWRWWRLRKTSHDLIELLRPNPLAAQNKLSRPNDLDPVGSAPPFHRHAMDHLQLNTPPPPHACLFVSLCNHSARFAEYLASSSRLPWPGFGIELQEGEEAKKANLCTFACIMRRAGALRLPSSRFQRFVWHARYGEEIAHSSVPTTSCPSHCLGVWSGDVLE